MPEQVDDVPGEHRDAPSPPVAVLGLGSIGLPVARALVNGGYVVHGLDRSAENLRVAAGHGVLTEDVRTKPGGVRIDVLVCSLPGPSEVVEALLDSPESPLGLLAPGGRVIDMTTNSPRVGRRFARRCAELGLAFVDAPVSEMPPNMVVMAGCDGSDSVVAELFARVAKHVVYLGSPLAGYAAKLLHQYMFLSSLLAGAEAIRAANPLGVDGELLVAIAAEGSAYSNALTLFPGIERTGRGRRHSAPLRLLFKDVTLIKELDEDRGLGLQGIGVLQETLRSAMEELGENAPLYRLIDVVGSTERAQLGPGMPDRRGSR
jgi:4-hydroxybutyrate dehydrogenase/sulfolactaldehyde 3-reductase